MNTPQFLRHLSSRRLRRSATLLTALALAPIAAQAQESDGTSTGAWVSDGETPIVVGSQVHVVVQADEDGLLERHAVEVRFEDGDLSIRMNGKDVPQDRMRIEDGTIVLLDEKGNPIESVHLNVGTDHLFGRLPMMPGEDGENDFFFGAVEEPTVMLGIQLGVPDEALEHHLRLEAGTSTMVTSIYEGLPAHAAGMDRFDIITEVDGLKPAGPKALREVLATKEAGDRVSLRVISAGRPTTVEVTLAAYDVEAMAKARLIGDPARADGFFRMMGTADGDRHLGHIWSMDLERLPNVIVTPDQRTFELPDTAPFLHEMLTKTPPGEADTGELDDRLERLHDRMKMLERLLDEVLERAARDGANP